MPDTVSRKFPFADDLAMATQTVQFSEAEDTLGNDVEIMVNYYDKWRLCVNPGKTESCAFHLNNKMANAQLKVRLKDDIIRYNSQPKYLGIDLDRALTFSPHLTRVSQKLKARNNIMLKISGTDWGANAHTLRTTALSLVYSTAEFAAAVWYNSSHVQKIDTQLNETMRIITGSVQSTPLPWLHVLSNIAPPHLRRENAAHKEWFKYMEEPNLSFLPISSDLANPPPSRLVSRYPIWKDRIIQTHNYKIEDRWKQFWGNSPEFENKMLISDPTESVQGFTLPRKEWKILNRFRTGYGCCAEKMFLWKFSNSPLCDCDNLTIQSMSHIINDCPLRRFNGDIYAIHSLTPDSLNWIKNLDLNI